jgi:hypothetical protein
MFSRYANVAVIVVIAGVREGGGECLQSIAGFFDRATALSVTSLVRRWDFRKGRSNIAGTASLWLLVPAYDL